MNFTSITCIVFLILFSSCNLYSSENKLKKYPFESEPLENYRVRFGNSPVGGGNNYSNMVNIEDYEIANTLAELKDYLENGETKIFIPGDKVLTVTEPVNIKSHDVTIASDRGKGLSKGALIKLQLSNQNQRLYIFNITGTRIRVTGLRLKSNLGDGDAGGILYKPGIHKQRNHIKIDNCEIFNFGYAAIALQSPDNKLSTDVEIHHNYIHHNKKIGLGYGVAVVGANIFAEIIYNKFKFNRHSVTGNGYPSQSYTAAFNKSSNSTGVTYDMHGWTDLKHSCEELKKCMPGYSCNFGGGMIKIYSNTNVPNGHSFFRLRGYPKVGAYVFDNIGASGIEYRIWGKPKDSNCKLEPPRDSDIVLRDENWRKRRLVFNEKVMPPGYNYFQNK